MPDRQTPMRRKSDSEIERWLAVLMRCAHLAGVVWLGAALLAVQDMGHAPALLMLASGFAMLAMDLAAGRIALRELAGAFVLAKLALVAWMAVDARQAAWIFWALLVGSSIVSHAPKHFRHWPTRR
jgi:hypothetical protein